MPNEYDKILRETFKRPKPNLLKLLLEVDVQSIQAFPPKVQQTIIEQEADTVLEVQPVTGSPFILHLEWQSSNDKKMAMRMARYDLLLSYSYEKEVMGAVIYVGKNRLAMNNQCGFYGFHYTCPIIDIRNIPPEVFLSSTDPGEVVLAILTDKATRQGVIQEILRKLRILTEGDEAFFQEKVRHLEILSQLRDNDLQTLLKEEEEHMPIILDIKKDFRYQQGVTEGIQEGGYEKQLEIARNMLKEHFPASMITKLTGIQPETLQELKNKKQID
ncbi:conserved hypothetical protein (putative transposase or invertase) [Filimonas lacunae]|uniref:Transposase (putative) YhgA-like domain-containing protein n=1 Tax=Filimonas lacunae TaxID=477680 RepID=A0A173MDQ1_9BACT|nr:hypothetical protein [Filimonas lacunae]BAV05647.1 hypothetical protein FLA_1658 [Filimonas lacunae]SIT29060.1 conserved hypothetical protein (putative transposase or invertase) [Filimonas lacunae]